MVILFLRIGVSREAGLEVCTIKLLFEVSELLLFGLAQALSRSRVLPGFVDDTLELSVLMSWRLVGGLRCGFLSHDDMRHLLEFGVESHVLISQLLQLEPFRQVL